MTTANRFHKTVSTWYAIDKARRVVFGPYRTNKDGSSLAVQCRKVSDPGKMPLDQSNVLLLDHLPVEYKDWLAGDYATVSRENTAFDAKQAELKKAAAKAEQEEKERKRAEAKARQANSRYIASPYR